MADQRLQFAKWLKAARKARFGTQQAARAAMHAVGLDIDEGSYSQWESGSRVPRDDNPKKARLYEFFGSKPQEATADGDPIAAAIDRQTKALTALVRELQLERSEDRAQVEGIHRALVALGQSLPPQQAAAMLQELPALRKTTG